MVGHIWKAESGGRRGRSSLLMVSLFCMFQIHQTVNFRKPILLPACLPAYLPTYPPGVHLGDGEQLEAGDVEGQAVQPCVEGNHCHQAKGGHCL